MTDTGFGRRSCRRRGMSVQGILVTVGVVLAILGAACFAVTLWQRTRALPEVARIVICSCQEKDLVERDES